MSAREQGKKLLAEMGSKVRKEIAPSGEPLLHGRGQRAVSDLAHDLEGPDGPPGLRVFRDAPDRFRLQRPGKNPEISVAWQRAIGAVVVVTEHDTRRDPEVRYLLNEATDEWHRMDGDGELYADVIRWLGELLYPESKR